jgi:protein-S-isoprenylcysteine O-methyltransferase Ste14
MRRLDYPPLWLLLFLALAWAQSALWPTPWAGDWAAAAGGLLALAGAGLMAAAVPPFLRARTTILPHRQPSALVTSGVFRLSRNPIYLGDVLILAGLAIRWQAWPALLLVPVFVRLLTRRFIEPEEARLRAAFGPAFEAWAGRTRRWI